MHSRRDILNLIAAATLAGCGPRGQFGVAASTPDLDRTQTLLVATTRAANPAPIAYGAARSETLDFARLAISIPPNHKAGRVEWPRGPQTDPARHFALVGAAMFKDIEAFTAALRRTAADSNGDAVLFVHGYNTTFAEGVYRHAQIAWDYGLKGPQIHFAWASAAHTLGYTYDRDSALIARDGLVAILLRLLREDRLRLTLVGHSMGGFLVMEALRQIALQGRRATLQRLAGVTLIAPDIDIDLFRAQAAYLSPLPQPFSVAVARNDRLLQLSSRLAGGQARLGSVADLAQLGDLGVFVIDLTELGGSGTNHFLAGTSPAAIALIAGLRNAGASPTQDITLGPVRVTLGTPGATATN